MPPSPAVLGWPGASPSGRMHAVLAATTVDVQCGRAQGGAVLPCSRGALQDAARSVTECRAAECSARGEGRPGATCMVCSRRHFTAAARHCRGIGDAPTRGGCYSGLY
jgi:hypothetical protein